MLSKLKKFVYKIFLVKQEKGIAILFTLGILALLMVLALGFATNAIMEQKVAYNNASRSQAKLLVQSGVNRVVAMLENKTSDLLGSHEDTTSTNAGTNDGIDNIETTLEFNLSDLNGTSGAILDFKTGIEALSSWEYATVNDGSNNRIIGRIAYVLINQNGIDPGAVVEAGTNEFVALEIRKGVDVKEINLRGLSYTDSGTGTTYSPSNPFMNWFGTSNGRYFGAWRDYDSLYNSIGLTDTAIQNYFRKWFVIDKLKSPEAFWLDIDATPDGAVDNTVATTNAAYELFHRFNLARTNWDSLDISTSILTDLNTGGSSSDKWSNSSTTNDGTCIPWLRYFGTNDAGADDATYKDTFSNVATRRKQIAANLKDYCDSDSKSTSDQTTTWNSANRPTYTGNENTLYISKVGGYAFVDSITVSDHTIFGILYAKTIVFSVHGYLGAQLVNMHGADLKAGTYTLHVRGGFKCSAQSSGTASDECDIKYETSSPITIFADGSTPSTVWAIDSSNANQFSESLTLSTVLLSRTITCSARLYIDSAWLESPDGHADYVNIGDHETTDALGNPSSSTPLDTGSKQIYSATVNSGLSLTGTPGNTLYGMASLKLGDPRQNLNHDDWEINSTDTAVASGNSGSFSSSAISWTTPSNTNSKDTESLSSFPDGISTAYIRNGSMQSPWELGAIHRGAAWETINLKKYNTTCDVLYPRGGRSYADGDANILDQVKMDSNVENQKVNIKIPYRIPVVNDFAIVGQNILEGFYYNLYYGGDYNSYTSGTHLDHTGTELATISSNIESLRTSGPFNTRASVASVLSAFGSNDRDQEALLGKSVNLSTVEVEPEYFSLLIIAQSIHDVGGVTISKNINGTVTTKATTLATYDENFDEIIAEQKALVRIHRDPTTGKCKILSLDYVD